MFLLGFEQSDNNVMVELSGRFVQASIIRQGPFLQKLYRLKIS